MISGVNKKIWLGVTLGLQVSLLLFCGKPSAYTRLEGNAQGTTFSIVYRDSLKRDFSLQVDSLFRLIDKSMSLWDEGSIISRLNRNEPGVRADEHFSAVFTKAREVSEATGGAFDVTVGPLVKAWGFSIKKDLPPPDSMQVDSLLQLVGYQKVIFENGWLVKPDPRMEIDFNAIAQGYTVDLIAGFLMRNGVRDYMVEVGGEVRTAGITERNTVWNIGIDKPLANESEGRVLQATVALDNKSLATSGSYRKFVVRDGRRFSHAIDPATGFPITHNLLSVSVLAGDCTTADAYATAFLVLGMEKAKEIARNKDLEWYCIYEDDNGRLQVQYSPGFPLSK